jgi:hypothetical protein
MIINHWGWIKTDKGDISSAAVDFFGFLALNPVVTKSSMVLEKYLKILLVWLKPKMVEKFKMAENQFSPVLVSVNSKVNDEIEVHVLVQLLAKKHPEIFQNGGDGITYVFSRFLLYLRLFWTVFDEWPHFGKRK